VSRSGDKRLNTDPETENAPFRVICVVLICIPLLKILYLPSD